MADTYNIDFSFLEKHEGGIKDKAYVPVCTTKSTLNKASKICYQKTVGTVIGNSGVTIAAGLDLGQQNEKGLKDMNIPLDIIETFKPYLALRKDDAKKKLEQKPLQLTSQQARMVDGKVKDKYVKDLRKQYNAKSAKDFYDLPMEAQTAILSFFYQNGWRLKNDFHVKYYDAVTKQDWKKAVDVLKSATTYPDRRKDEAALLQKVVPPVGDFNNPFGANKPV